MAKGTPPEAERTLREMARKATADPAFPDSMAKAHVPPLCTEPRAFSACMAAHSPYFPRLLGCMKIGT